jgi:DnaJ-domain-containing protein 1
VREKKTMDEHQATRIKRLYEAHKQLKGVTDPHKVLGIEPGASRDEIEQAYAQLFMRSHSEANHLGLPKWVNDMGRALQRKYARAHRELRGHPTAHPAPGKEKP